MTSDAISRRFFIAGAGSLMATPAVVRAASIMPVKRLYPKAVMLGPDMLWANGAELSKAQYPELAKLGERFGNPSESTFLLPDLRSSRYKTAILGRTIDRDSLLSAGMGIPVASRVPLPPRLADGVTKGVDGVFRRPGYSVDDLPHANQDFIAWNSRAKLLGLRSFVSEWIG